MEKKRRDKRAEEPFFGGAENAPAPGIRVLSAAEITPMSMGAAVTQGDREPEDTAAAIMAPTGKTPEGTAAAAVTTDGMQADTVRKVIAEQDREDTVTADGRAAEKKRA